MKARLLVIGLASLIMTMLLVGCGISEELYTATLAERDSLAANLQSAQSELDAAKSEILAIQGELESIQAEFQSVNDELNTKISNLQTVESELDAKTSELDTVVAEKNALQGELDEINLIYPPGEFSSLGELESWALDNRQPRGTYIEESFRSALKMQQLGLQDGYLISVIYDEDDTDPDGGWIYNGALVNGRWYIWHPEYAEVYSWYSNMLVK